MTDLLILQLCLVLTGVCCWLFWMICYMSQMNPLIGAYRNIRDWLDIRILNWYLAKSPAGYRISSWTHRMLNLISGLTPDNWTNILFIGRISDTYQSGVGFVPKSFSIYKINKMVKGKRQILRQNWVNSVSHAHLYHHLNITYMRRFFSYDFFLGPVLDVKGLYALKHYWGDF